MEDSRSRTEVVYRRQPPVSSPRLRSLVQTVPSALFPPPGGRIFPRLRTAIRRLWLYAVVVAIAIVYFLFMSAGGLNHWPVYGTYIDLMAEGFRQGQLHMPIDPAPQLLRAKDPYAWENYRYWALDATYYAGKYYGYWGPVPALLQSAGKSLLGVQRIVGDHYVSLFHLCVGAWAGVALIERMARRIFGGISRPLLALCCFALAFANPTLHGATTAGTYHAAIIAAQAWLLVGLVPAFDAVFFGGTQRVQGLRLVLAGAAWSLCLASRVALLPCVALLALITVLMEASSVRSQRVKHFLSSAFALGLPLAIVGGALLVYNKARFDQWLEFGIKLQLSAFPYRVGPEYVIPNLYAYSLRPFVTSCEFPYVFQVWRMGSGAFAEGFPLPKGYTINEPVIGWLVAIPLAWLLPFALLCLPRSFRLERPEHRAYLWCLASFSVIAAVGGIASLGGYSATMRYLSDMSNGVVLAAVLAGFALKSHRLGKLVPRTTSTLIALLALATIALGMAIGYQGYNGHFARYNPALHEKLIQLFSVCGDEPPNIPQFTPR